MGTATGTETRQTGVGSDQGDGIGAQSRGSTAMQGREMSGATRSPRDGEGLANALGWFSIGLGVSQIVAPRRMARMIGVGDDDRQRILMRAIGVREIIAGIGILTQPRPAGWVWTRVAGDMMDLALLGGALTSEDSDHEKTSATTAAVLAVMALDVRCGQQLTRDGRGAEHQISVRRSVTVRRPQDEVYRFWRNFENLPRFMSHLESVQVIDDRHSHWKARAPAGRFVEWDAEIVEDRPSELIAWRSVERADVANVGSVRFTTAPGRRGTEVHVEINYVPPGGLLGAKIAKLFRKEPSEQVEDNLRAFKQVMETGEVVLSDATLRRGLHPARPDPSPSPA